MKPCPFCGGEAVANSFLDCGDLECLPVDAVCDSEVTCENERCINGWYLPPEIWNTRPIEDELRKRIAELEGENKKAFDFVKTLRTYCIYAHWDNPDTEGEFNEFDAEICKWLSEFTERER